VGCRQARAVTAPGNDGSIRFHQRLGFDVSAPMPSYNGSEQAKVIFTRSLDQDRVDQVCETGAMISIDDFLYYVDDALDAMVRIVSELGDDLANRRPDVPGANSPFAILTHCLGVMEYWGGEVVAGRAIVRDRAAEFRATGRVAELTDRAQRVRQQLRADIAALDPFGPPRGSPPVSDSTLPLARTQGGALLHIYEELAQHRGQLEITRDVLRARVGW
jgi:hypothetical protein